VGETPAGAARIDPDGRSACGGVLDFNKKFARGAACRRRPVAEKHPWNLNRFAPA